MPRPLDWPRLEEALLAKLGDGPTGAAELQEALAISQPSLSRLLARLPNRVVAFGQARHRRYALRRTAEPLPMRVFEADRLGEVRLAFVLEAIHPRGVVVAEARRVPPRVFDELPWFLQDLRPSGLLARRLGAPDARRHDGEVLAFLKGKSDLPGAWLFGEAAVAQRSARHAEPPDLVPRDERAELYAAWTAMEVPPLGWVPGDRPKLLATRRDHSGDVPVLVKYSPPRGRPAANRWADLLVAEHLALATLAEAGHAAVASELIESEGRLFLEIERFDRTRHAGRRNLVSLRTLHREHLTVDPGQASASTGRLLDLGLLDETTHRAVRLREQFVEWIGGPVLTLDDVSFVVRGFAPGPLAPAWGVSPGAWAPGRGDVVPDLEPPIRLALPSNADVVVKAHAAATTFWERLHADVRVSAGFRDVAEQTLSRLHRVRPT